MRARTEDRRLSFWEPPAPALADGEEPSVGIVRPHFCVIVTHSRRFG
jgi:hypothetical protein